MKHLKRTLSIGCAGTNPSWNVSSVSTAHRSSMHFLEDCKTFFTVHVCVMVVATKTGLDFIWWCSDCEYTSLRETMTRAVHPASGIYLAFTCHLCWQSNTTGTSKISIRALNILFEWYRKRCHFVTQLYFALPFHLPCSCTLKIKLNTPFMIHRNRLSLLWQWLLDELVNWVPIPEWNRGIKKHIPCHLCLFIFTTPSILRIASLINHNLSPTYSNML